MKIGAPKEITEGEKRVAMTPQSALALKKLGYDCVIEAGAGDGARFPDAAYAEAGVEVAASAAASGRGRTSWSRCARPSRPRLELARGGPDADLASSIRRRTPELLESREGAGRHRHRDGHGAAHQPRAEDGRAVVDGQHRRLPRGDRGGRQLRPLLHRPGHGGGQGAAGQGAGDRRRRRGPRGHRHGDLARRDHLCLRRAPRSGRADRIDGRAVRLSSISRKPQRTAPRPAAMPRPRARSSARSSSRSSASWRPRSTSSSPRR